MSGNILLTGASSGIGQQIAKKFLNKNYNVYAIARDFSKCDIQNNNFHKIIIDLACSKEIEKNLKNLKNISIIINCAGFGIFEQYEDIKSDTLINLINVNLLAPMIIVNTLLKQIKQNKGYIFNINSIEAIERNKFSAGYTASKAGLKAFGESLFEEVRKDGVKVININPDITKTNFFNKLHFMPYNDKENYINVDEICDVVFFALEHKECIISDITIKTQKRRIQKNIKINR
jgi:short-subunit dehydrogenase